MFGELIQEQINGFSGACSPHLGRTISLSIRVNQLVVSDRQKA